MAKSSFTKSSGARRLGVKVRTAKGRKTSSTHWLQRQLNDPYVAKAQSERVTGPVPRSSWPRLTTSIQFLKSVCADRGSWGRTRRMEPGGGIAGSKPKWETGQVIAVDIEIDGAARRR